MSITKKIKGILFHPSEIFADLREESIEDVFKYSIGIMLIFAILSAAIQILYLKKAYI